MNLKECVTCGSHEFDGNKCAYCGNVYEIEPTWEEILEEQEQELDFPEMDEVGGLDLDFSEEHVNNKGIKFMLGLLVAIIWFAITVFLPPLFLLTICGLIIWGCKWLIKKGEKK